MSSKLDLKTIPVYKRFWWPDPYARPFLWRKVVIGYRYFINGVDHGTDLLNLKPQVKME